MADGQGDVLYTIEQDQNGSGYTIVWASLTQNQRFGESYPRLGERSSMWHPDKTLHVQGTYGGAVWKMEGSNFAPTSATDSIVYATVNDQSDNAVSGTTDLMETIVHNPRHIRPILATTTALASVQFRLTVTTGRGQMFD